MLRERYHPAPPAPLDLDWQLFAACSELEVEESDPLFFAGQGQSRLANQARAICAACEVQGECLYCESGDGSPLDPDEFSKSFKRIAAKAGLHPDAWLHDVRHAVATTLLEQGTDTAITAAILGHNNPYSRPAPTSTSTWP